MSDSPTVSVTLSHIDIDTLLLAMNLLAADVLRDGPDDNVTAILSLRRRVLAWSQAPAAPEFVGSV